MIKLTTKQKEHYEAGLYTANLIKYCYKKRCVGNNISPEKFYALCMLSWWSPRDIIKIKALWILWDKAGKPPTKNDIEVLEGHKFPMKVMELAYEWTGLVNFYKAYRKTARVWIKRNYKKLLPLIRKSAKLKTNTDVIDLAKSIDRLPKIPKANKQPGKMSPASLLTPLFASLDPRLQFPIVNKNKFATALRRKLKISGHSLAEKVQVLVGLINQQGLSNSMVLDSVNKKLSTMKLHIELEDFKKPEYARTKLLNEKDDHDITVIVTKRNKKAVLLHNKMTNHLLKICEQKKFRILEGREPYKFDALIKNYNHKGRDLLIEAKSSIDRSHLRLAVGQLFDYRRGLQKRAITDLSILLPSKPARGELNYLADVGVTALWYTNKKYSNIISNEKIEL